MGVSVRSAVGAVAIVALLSGVAAPVAAEEMEHDLSASEALLALPLEDSSPIAEEPPTTPEESETVDIPEGLFEPELVENLPLTGGEALDTIAPQNVGEFDAAAPPPDSEIIARDEYSTTYRLGDGVNLTANGVEPMNVRYGGQWQEISTDVEGEGFWSFLGGGIGEAERHPLSPRFAATADEEAVLRLERAGYEFAYRLVGARSAGLERNSVFGDRSTVEYRDVFTNTDLVYQVQPGAVKQLFRLKQAPGASDRVSWVWEVDTDGLSLVEGEGGVIEFQEADGDTIVAIPPLRAWDSASEAGEQANSLTELATKVEKVGDVWRIEVSVERDWLLDEKRVYPVMVDPTATSSNVDNTRGFKTNGQYNYNYGIQIGNTNENGIWRTTAHYEYERYYGKQVLESEIVFGAISGDSTTTNRTGGLYHASSFSYGGIGSYLGPISTTASSGRVQDDRLTNQLAAWVRSKTGGAHLMHAGDESATYTYKHFQAATLWVAWKDFPTAGTIASPSPSNGGNSGETPTLKISGSKDPGGGGLAYRFRIGTGSNPDTSKVWESAWSTSAQVTVPALKLEPGKKYWWKAEVKDGYDGDRGFSTLRASPVYSFTVRKPAAPAQAAASPKSGSVVSTLTPTFTAPAATNSLGETPTYKFTVASGTDAQTGAVASSGWLSTPTWKVPAGVLQDGGGYTWTVRTKDGYGESGPPWVSKLVINMRQTSSGPQPMDEAGPVQVNLANGNLTFGFSSPTVTTVGGPMGLSFSYSSQQPSNAGLTGSYFDATPAAGVAADWAIGSRKPVLVRTDAQVSFLWGSGSPGPALPKDNFLVRWDGFIRVPTAGTYKFGVVRDNGVRLSIGGSKLIDKYTNTHSAGAVEWGGTRSFTDAAQTFSMEYFDGTSTASAQLWVEDPAGKKFVVPGTWFTKTLETLPQGWAASTPVAGAASAYSSAKVTEGAVTLTDRAGATHTYAKSSDGGYKPPPGEYGTLAIDKKGKVALTDESGLVHVFQADGKVAHVVSPLDAKKPATPVLTYRADGRLDRISDPLSKQSNGTYTREVRFAYGSDTASAVGLSGSDTDSTGKACPVPSGYAEPKPEKLCRIVYPGHKAGGEDTTRLFYDSSGRLARILDPGSEGVSFAYDGHRVTGIRDALQTDWVLADPSRTTNPESRTTIQYDSSGRVTLVALAASHGVVGERPGALLNGPVGHQDDESLRFIRPTGHKLWSRTRGLLRLGSPPGGRVCCHPGTRDERLRRGVEWALGAVLRQ